MLRWFKNMSFQRFTLLLMLLSFTIGGVLRGLLHRDVPWDKGIVGDCELRTIKQSQGNSCGPAALAMVASAWGVETSERELMFLAQTTSAGTTLSNLAQAGNFIGLDIYGLKLNVGHLAKANKPLIAYINNRHAVVVESVRKAELSIINPAHGKRKTLPVAEFSKMWQGACLVVVGKHESKPFITDWLITGRYEKEQSLFDLTEDHKLDWKSVNEFAFSQSSRLINLIELLGQGEKVIAYAKTYMYSPRKQSVQFRIGSDDGVQLWLNGQSLLEKLQVARSCMLDQDIVPAVLHRGWNQLLLQIVQIRGDWQFAFRITDEQGAPLPDLKFQSENPLSSRDRFKTVD